MHSSEIGALTGAEDASLLLSSSKRNSVSCLSISSSSSSSVIPVAPDSARSLDHGGRMSIDQTLSLIDTILQQQRSSSFAIAEAATISNLPYSAPVPIAARDYQVDPFRFLEQQQGCADRSIDSLQASIEEDDDELGELRVRSSRDEGPGQMHMDMMMGGTVGGLIEQAQQMLNGAHGQVPSSSSAAAVQMGGGSGAVPMGGSDQMGGVAVAQMGGSGAEDRPLEGEEAIADQEEGMDMGGGGGGGGGGGAGSRWPREETLALLRIRHEMDLSFRDSNVKRPLWEEVSRKLGELGYERSAKKCKEKFENVNKYYKRTKGGKAGARQDGKNYRFFTQLEALMQAKYNNTAAAAAMAAAAAVPPTSNKDPPSLLLLDDHNQASAAMAMAATATAGPSGSAAAAPLHPPGSVHYNFTDIPAAAGGHGGSSSTRPSSATAMAVPSKLTISSSSPSSSSPSSSDESTTDDDIDEGLPRSTSASRSLPKKRKRKSKRNSSVIAFFEGWLQKLLDKQEQMQQKFLEALERKESDRAIREDVWRRQEMARMSRENDLRSQERNSAAIRDAAIVAFLQKVTGQTVQLPPPAPPAPTSSDAVAAGGAIAAQPVQIAPPLHLEMGGVHQLQQLSVPALHLLHEIGTSKYMNVQSTATVAPAAAAGDLEASRPFEASSSQQQQQQGGGEDPEHFDPNSRRWHKPEVLALIKLHGELRSKFNESGAKGHLWEEISKAMASMGYHNKSAKRCKEKWENINKYFKKLAKSNAKKRPENAKTCPYFHELDALYRKGSLGSSANVQTSAPAVTTPANASTQPQQQQAKQAPPYKPSLELLDGDEDEDVDDDKAEEAGHNGHELSEAGTKTNSTSSTLAAAAAFMDSAAAQFATDSAAQLQMRQQDAKGSDGH